VDRRRPAIGALNSKLVLREPPHAGRRRVSR